MRRSVVAAMGDFDLNYDVKVYEEDGTMWAEVVQLPGCFVTGDTLEEIEEALQEAIPLYLSSEGVDVELDPVKLTNPVDSTDGSEQYKLAVSA
jgi:predicted RNase H-like HicB family nuclease